MTKSRKGGAGGKRKEYSAPALEKGLDIIEALANEPEGLTSAEISSRLGRPMGQFFRMLSCYSNVAMLPIKRRRSTTN